MVLTLNFRWPMPSFTVHSSKWYLHIGMIRYPGKRLFEFRLFDKRTYKVIYEYHKPF